MRSGSAQGNLAPDKVAVGVKCAGAVAEGCSRGLLDVLWLAWMQATPGAPANAAAADAWIKGAVSEDGPVLRIVNLAKDLLTQQLVRRTTPQPAAQRHGGQTQPWLNPRAAPSAQAARPGRNAPAPLAAHVARRTGAGGSYGRCWSQARTALPSYGRGLPRASCHCTFSPRILVVRHAAGGTAALASTCTSSVPPCCCATMRASSKLRHIRHGNNAPARRCEQHTRIYPGQCCMYFLSSLHSHTLPLHIFHSSRPVCPSCTLSGLYN